ncbi:UDP-glycosyltransferase UGT4-like [Diabrotica undecimpunctata]|uniref:UDP-glycosyltransferase UGT4-like n=1 Tax=Diabrotica undecimpunctata TaxID=50387 RepID=UPI003B638D4C
MKVLTCIYLVILNGILFVDSFKILMMFNFFGKSHYFSGKSLAKGLAKAGHEVTLVSVFKDTDNVKEYTELVLEGVNEQLGINSSLTDMVCDTTAVNTVIGVAYLSKLITEITLGHKKFQSMLKSNQTFDLIIQEDLYNDALKGLSWRYNAPIILFSVFSSTNHLVSVTGSSAPSSYVPNIWSRFSYPMTFWQRSMNFFLNTMESILLNFNTYVLHQWILDKYFPGAPNIDTLNKNVALIFVNNHESVVPAMPQVPNMVNILGFHLKEDNKLPNELQDFMDEAKYGVILFSFGTFINVSEINNNTKVIFLKSFGKLKQRIIWKSDEYIIEKPDNVRTEKWIPQEEILAHPNCKLFITHGGYNSVIETIYHAVPVLAMPLIGDQHLNAARIVDLNIGLSTSFRGITEEILDSLLEELLTNNKYQQNIRRRSNLLKDRPVKPMDLVTYWVDYVIRHKDLSHMRLSGIDLAWYQYYSVDVIFVWGGGFMAVIFLLRRFFNIYVFKYFKDAKVKTN